MALVGQSGSGELVAILDQLHLSVHFKILVPTKILASGTDVTFGAMYAVDPITTSSCT